MLKVDFKYERLLHFCFLCRMMTHINKDCSVVSDEKKKGGYHWGLFIKDSLEKG